MTCDTQIHSVDYTCLSKVECNAVIILVNK